MGSGTGPETSRDRRALVADAGYKRFSLFSALAGAVVALGTLTVVAAAAGRVVTTDAREINLPAGWWQVDLGEGLLAAAAVAVAFLFGGYVVGRMARRAGTVHGVAVFVLGMGAVAAGFLAAEVTAPAAVVVVSLAAAAAAAVLGGVLGERWHARLVGRALNPDIGAEAKARRDAEKRAADAEELRTGSFRRARRATPTRSRRVDAEAMTAEHDLEPQTPASSARTRPDNARS